MATTTDSADEQARARTADQANHVVMGGMCVRRLVEATIYLIDDNHDTLWTGSIKQCLETIRDIASTQQTLGQVIYDDHGPDVPF